VRALRAVDVRRLAAGKGHRTLAKNKQQKEQKGGVVQTRADMVLHRLRRGRVAPCVTNGEATATGVQGEPPGAGDPRRALRWGASCGGRDTNRQRGTHGCACGSLRGYKQVLLKGVVVVVVTRAMDRRS